MEVSAPRLLENLASLRRHLVDAGHAGVGILPMVKADAYGLGADPVVETLVRHAGSTAGIAGWGVATVDEGLGVLQTLARVAGPSGRGEAPFPRVQVFSPVTPEEAERGWRAGLHLSLSDLAVLHAGPRAEGAESGMRVFDVEIDTGMGRAGLPDRDVSAWAEAILARLDDDPSLRWHGVFTHLHSADDADEAQSRGSVAVQLQRFAEARTVLAARLADRGHPPLCWHVGNSAGVVRYPELVGSEMALVRPGVSLYGGGLAMHGYVPRSVVSVYARVTRVADVPAGSSLGYGATHRSAGPERWATLAIGYGDGLPRALSNRGRVILHGQQVPIVGRISMDMTVVEVSKLGAGSPRVGDVACVVGTAGTDTPDVQITLQDVAEQAGTIDYEILTGWTARLPRVWTGSESASSLSPQSPFDR